MTVVMPLSKAFLPNTSPTAASAAADLNGRATQIACETILNRLKEVAAPLIEAETPEDVTIENGFVFLPNEAAWLDDYLHEIAAFPKGRYDDQVDATAQFLDWFKKPMPNGAIFEYYRTLYERKNYPERFRLRLQAPEGIRSTHVGVASGRMLPVNADGTAEMSEQDAHSFITHLGWKKIDQWYVDEDDE